MSHSSTKQENICDPLKSSNISSQDKVRILSEALPFMQKYFGKIIVIKYGGHAMGDLISIQKFARDIVFLALSGVKPVIVHGGGPQISSMLNRLNIPSLFHNGLRITDRETIEIVEMVLAGSVNKQIVAATNAVGGRAVGLSGKDGKLLTARKLSPATHSTDAEATVDLGFVGEPESLDCSILHTLCDSGFIPVIAPIADSLTGESYNVNADIFAGAIAGALRAERFLLLTDISGVLDKNKQLIKELSPEKALQLIKDGTISGGMIPKIETCLYALRCGVSGVVIVNGQVPHATLLELYTEYGEGTIIH